MDRLEMNIETKYSWSSILMLGIILMLFAFQAEEVSYKDASQPVERRVTDLLSKMTLEEKIYQLSQGHFGINLNENNKTDQLNGVDPQIGSLINFSNDPELRNNIQKLAMEESRLGIPILFGFDVVYSLRTVFPISLGQACSWNPTLVKQSTQVLAREARMSGVDWTFAPVVDVARDPRWGRMSEGYGEDPYATSVFGVAAVEGFQGDSLNTDHTVAATLKHFVGYGASEGGRDYHYTEISDQTLWDVYLPPFEACIKAGAATVMSSFNDISGVPGSANHYTLTEILKEKWGHDGFVVSDWNSIIQLINQGAAKNKKHAAELAFNSGIELCMVDNSYLHYLGALIEEGKVSMELVDESVARILRLKFKLGLFENPYTKITKPEERYLLPESKAIAEQLAEESFVLLKNKRNVLPLKVEKIALIGPMIHEKEDLLGVWSKQHGRPEDAISIAEGMLAEFEGIAQIDTVKACAFLGEDRSGFARAKEVATAADVVVICLGEERRWSGEDGNRSFIEYHQIQEDLVQEMVKTGKPIVLVLSSGRTKALKNIEPLADAMLMVWQPGIMGGKAIAETLSGRANPSGKLSITVPYTTGQIPLYYSMRQAGRPHQGHYRHLTKEPMYWFGYGLSYTTFEYGALTLSDTIVSKTGKITAEVEITNSGEMDGKEAVLWYITDPYASITRPVKELKYFEKKMIKTGETLKYTFEIDPIRDLSYPNSQGDRMLESGDFFIHVGAQTVRFELVE